MDRLIQIPLELLAGISRWIDDFGTKHNGAVQIITVLLGIAALLAGRKGKQLFVSVPSVAGREVSRGDLLEKVQNDVIEPRLRDGLRRAIRVDSAISESPASVRPGLKLLKRLESGPVTERLLNEPIQEIFRKTASSRLLVLGQPGAGKTNVLCELAEFLIAEARTDTARPIPVVFDLARWTRGGRGWTIEEWMKDDLKRWYGYTSHDAEIFIDKYGILPMLDGLDEVAADKREACVDAIHEYQREQSSGPLVICCRTNEYDRLQQKLNLGAAIRVELLRREDVERTIAKPAMSYVREALKSDPVLWEILDTPLMLHVLYLAANSDFESGETSESARDRLYGRYVKHFLLRKQPGADIQRTSEASMLRWLGWLAQELKRRDQTQFALEDLDASWLTSSDVDMKSRHGKDSRKRGVQLTGSFLSTGHAQRVLFGVVVGAMAGLLGGIEFGILASVIAVSRYEGKILPAEHLEFTARNAMAGIGRGVASGLVFGGVFAWAGGWKGGLLVGLLAAAFEIMLGGLQPRSTTDRSEPNRVTLRSLRYALYAVVAGMSIAASLIVLGWVPSAAAAFSPDGALVLTRAGIWAGFGAVMIGWERGGSFALRHYVIRLMLRWRDLAPLQYADFLDESVKRHFMVRRGGNYEFFHATFRDYMAQEYWSNNSNRRSRLQKSEIEAQRKWADGVSAHRFEGVY